MDWIEALSLQILTSVGGNSSLCSGFPTDLLKETLCLIVRSPMFFLLTVQGTQVPKFTPLPVLVYLRK